MEFLRMGPDLPTYPTLSRWKTTTVIESRLAAKQVLAISLKCCECALIRLRVLLVVYRVMQNLGKIYAIFL